MRCQQISHKFKLNGIAFCSGNEEMFVFIDYVALINEHRPMRLCGQWQRATENSHHCCSQQEALVHAQRYQSYYEDLSGITGRNVYAKFVDCLRR